MTARVVIDKIMELRFPSTSKLLCEWSQCYITNAKKKVSVVKIIPSPDTFLHTYKITIWYLVTGETEVVFFDLNYPQWVTMLIKLTKQPFGFPFWFFCVCISQNYQFKNKEKKQNLLFLSLLICRKGPLIPGMVIWNYIQWCMCR